MMRRRSKNQPATIRITPSFQLVGTRDRADMVAIIAMAVRKVALARVISSASRQACVEFLVHQQQTLMGALLYRGRERPATSAAFGKLPRSHSQERISLPSRPRWSSHA